MDHHSRHVYLTGVLYIAACLSFTLPLVTRTLMFVVFGERALLDLTAPNTTSDLLKQSVYGGVTVMLAFLATFMIHGVAEKKLVLILPFLIIHSFIGGIVILASLLAVSSYCDSFRFFYSLGQISLSIAIPVLFLYPIYTLCEKFQSQTESGETRQNSTLG